MNAASSGPSAEPALPPTWNSDCASPCRPPEARRATREASGWNTAEPMPTSAAARRSSGSWPPCDSRSSPTRVSPCRRERERLRAAVGVQPDQRLQQRGGELERERDEADLREVEANRRILQDRVDRRQQRLDSVVQKVRHAQRRRAPRRSCLPGPRPASGRVVRRRAGPSQVFSPAPLGSCGEPRRTLRAGLSPASDPMGLSLPSPAPPRKTAIACLTGAAERLCRYSAGVGDGIGPSGARAAARGALRPPRRKRPFTRAASPSMNR